MNKYYVSIVLHGYIYNNVALLPRYYLILTYKTNKERQQFSGRNTGGIFVLIYTIHRYCM